MASKRLNQKDIKWLADGLKRNYTERFLFATHLYKTKMSLSIIKTEGERESK